MFRSVIAVVTGFVVIAVLAIGTDVGVRSAIPSAFDATGRTDSIPILLLTIAYVAVYAIGGCYLAARMAPSSPMKHAMVLGALGLVFNVAGSAAMWDTAPAWYHMVQVGMVLPYAWIGGRLRQRQLDAAGADAGAGAQATV
jgi:hypothetical protein